MSNKLFVLLLFAFSAFASYQQWNAIYQKISQETEYSSWFFTAIKNNRIAKLNLLYNDLTLFVPENQAVDDYGDVPDNLAFYHMSFEVKTLQTLNSSMKLASANLDDPPLWITKTSSNQIFVNDAKIVEDRSNYVSRTREGKHQVLHVIDRVLDPLTKSAVPNATAYDFLRSYRRWSVRGESVSNFMNKVLQHGQQKLYHNTGGHTFFIPVDQKMDDYKLRNIDSYIIQGHIISDYVAFLRPTPKDFIMESASNGDYIYIVLSLHEENSKYFVKSYTVLGNSQHRRGESTAEILVANIPVANGVVHLISQPLAVFDRELKPFPYLPTSYKISADPTLNITHHLGEKYGLSDKLADESVIFTYFAPRDRGWGRYLNEDDLDEIIGRHLIMSTTRYTMEKLYELSQGNGTILNTLSGPTKFEVIKSLNDYYIKWKRKTIRVYRPDYECSDGIVHVIDEPFAEDLVGEGDGLRREGFYRKLKKIFTT